MPRMTRKVFTDLAVWMVGLGVLVGLLFPPALVLLGVPGALTLKPLFILACVAAGVLLAWANHRLARAVVGQRLVRLSNQMQYIGGVIREAAWTGDWGRCTPQECSLDVDSDDELGSAAASFNELVSSLAVSREVQQATVAMGRTLSSHLELDEFAPATLAALLGHVGAAGGALIVVRDGQLDVAATHHLAGGRMLAEDETVRAAMDSDEMVVMGIDERVHVEATLLTFRPNTVVVQPLRFRDNPVGALVLAFGAAPAPVAIKLLRSFSDPFAVALHNVLTHERFQRLAALDPLTGAYNRRFGTQRLHEEWARATRGAGHLGVLSLDLDHFKSINDHHGHLVGDRVLHEVAATVLAALREGEVLIRTGGEEFIVILPDTGLEELHLVGERIRQSIGSTRVLVADHPIGVTASLGGASTADGAITSPDMLVSTSDDALYTSKRSGRDRVTVATTPPTRHTDLAPLAAG